TAQGPRRPGTSHGGAVENGGLHHERDRRQDGVRAPDHRTKTAADSRHLDKDEHAMRDTAWPDNGAVESARQLDQLCTQFEVAWKKAGTSGQPPRVEDYVRSFPEHERSTLLHELILLEIDYRRLAGENPQAEEYFRRFPALDAAWLAEALGSDLGSIT